MSDTLFITGATSGFGEACARRFAEAGWKLVLTGRRAERLNALVQELSKQTEVHGMVVDVRERKGMEEAIANLPPSFATLRGLINNAGGGAPAEYDGYASHAATIKLNFTGTVLMTEACLPLLSDGGRIVMLSSGSAPSFVSKCSAERQVGRNAGFGSDAG